MTTSTCLESAPSLEPYGKHWKASRTKQCKEDEQLEYEIVTREVGRDAHCVGKDWARTLYHHIATSEDIKDFCNHPSSGFDIEQGQWTVLPKNPTDASELREPLVRLISTIITHFYPSLPAGVARNVVGPQEGQGLHDGNKHDIRPFIAIKAKGPSFAVPAKANEIGANGLGYCNIAAMVNVCLHKARGSRREQAEQSVRHCRQIFTQQANRCFARSMVITELGFRLIHHDRSGVYVTPWFSIHKEKEVFVRFVLGLSSPNEEDLGLDAAVQWVIDERTGRKVAGTIKVNEYDEEKETSQTVVYDLVMNKPPLLRPCIRSRGTVVWHAIHPTTGKPVIIKDAWRPSTQGGEYEYLLAARGIPGVVQIMGYEDRCAETIGYRPQDFEAPHFEDRIKLRLVLMEYGPCVSQFKTRLELFKALRDVLIGHRKLIDAGVLHRDISLQNILFGPADASEGQRGVLIDLDLAVWADGWSSPVDPDPRVGTRMYQSIAICRSFSIDLVPDQTYLDDLESLFYVVSHFLFGFNKPACMLPHRSISLFFRYLGSHDQELAAEAKNGYSLGPLCLRDVPSFWGKPCRTLLKDFQAIIREILVKKAEIRGDEDFNDDERLEAYDELAQQSDVYFKRVKAAFDKVIAALEEEGMNPDELEVTAKSRAPPQSAVPPALASVTAVAPGVSAVPVADSVLVTPMENAACNVPSSSRPPPPVVSTVVTPHEVPVPPTPVPSTIGAEPAAEISTSRGSPGASKKRPSDDGPHNGTRRKRHCNEQGVNIPSPVGFSKPGAKAAARSSRATSALAGKGQSSRSPAS